MEWKEKQRRSARAVAAIWRSRVGNRLLRALALAAIVGVALGALFATGNLGRQGGGVTESGVRIENARLLETSQPSGMDLEAGTQPGRLAPDFEVSAFGGNRVKLSAFRGRPVYLNFWATWCGPCQAEMPDIYRLQQERGGPDGLAVISVNRGEPLGRAMEFIESIEREDGGKGVTFTVQALDPDDTLYQAYRGLGMPLSVFIDRNGVVTRVYNGLMTLSDMEEAWVGAAEGWEP